MLSISDSSNFVVRNSYLYGGRNVHDVSKSHDFVFQNNQILLGQEHLGGPGDGTSNWTYVNNIMGLSGQEAPFVKANCGGTISNGTIHNNIVLDTSGPHVETFCPSNPKWNGISNIMVRNNLIIRTVPTVCLRSWAPNINSVDSDYNFCVFQHESAPRVFWRITTLEKPYNLQQWQTQTEFPQIRQDPNSKFLLNADPGFNTPLNQLLEVDGLDECSRYFTTGSSCMSNCKPPYRIRLKANFSLKDDSMLIAAGDPSYVKSPTGRRANVGLLQEPASVFTRPQRFRIVQ